MKPVILITLHDRYYELIKNLHAAEALRREFSTAPDVVLLWAQPDIGRLWVLQDFVQKNLINHLLTRDPLPHQGPITYMESHNIRKGLNYIFQQYQDCYAIVHTADILPAEGTFAEIDREMHSGKDAYLVHWENRMVPQGAFHTNFFAVGPTQSFWPPVANHDEHDCLEWLWGKTFQSRNLTNYHFTHNSGERLFRHRHESDEHSKWPARPQSDSRELPLVVRGNTAGFVGYLREVYFRLRHSRG